MASFNKAIIAGNLARDPEMRVTPQGTAIAQFGVAVNHKYTTAGGEKREEVSFFDCEAWGKTAELIAKYLKKGSGALIEGRLKQDTWEDKQSGQKRSKIKIVVESVQFLGSPDRSQRSDDMPTRSEQSSYTPPPFPGKAKPALQENLDEDVPF